MSRVVYSVGEAIRYHRKRDGVLRIERNGSCRFLTLWERVSLFFGGRP